MAVSKEDLGSIEEIEAMFTDALPAALAAFGAEELAPLVPVFGAGVKLLTDLIAQKTQLNDPNVAIAAEGLGALAELDAETGGPKP